jgi:hypothetical protein
MFFCNTACNALYIIVPFDCVPDTDESPMVVPRVGFFAKNGLGAVHGGVLHALLGSATSCP